MGGQPLLQLCLDRSVNQLLGPFPQQGGQRISTRFWTQMRNTGMLVHSGVSPLVVCLSRNNHSTRYAAVFQTRQTPDSVITLGWFVVGIFPKAIISAWNHHHQHLNTFKKSFYNRVLEVIYALHTGITTNTWVLHHNFGHHLNYLDQRKDESRWMDKKGNKMGVFRYTFVLAVTSYWRAFLVGKKHVKIRKIFILMILVMAVLMAALIFFRPIPALLVFVLPMATALIVTSYATYTHHTELSLVEHKHASRNIESKWYNKLTGNLGYHTAHHIRFGLHWSKLPRLHQELRNEIPEECIVPANAIFRLFDKLDILLSSRLPVLAT
jgi:fatty acid desaturase